MEVLTTESHTKRLIIEALVDRGEKFREFHSKQQAAHTIERLVKALKKKG